MRVYDLSDWPPNHFAVVGGVDRVPLHASQVSIGPVQNTLVDCVRFECSFEGNPVSCSFFVTNHEIAKKLADILTSHQGDNLLAIGAVDIPRT
jgi:hypothetical protein